MDLTPPAVSSLLSQYQLQQINPSRNNEQDNTLNIVNHNSSVKDKNKHVSRNDVSSPTQSSLAVRNYVSSLQPHQHGHQPSQNLHHIEQHQIHGQPHVIPDSNGNTGLQSQESSKFFMSSLLNLSSASTQPSVETTIPFQGQGKYVKAPGIGFKYIRI